MLVAFVEPSYTVREDVGTALVCLTKDLETVTSFNVDLFTTDSTAECKCVMKMHSCLGVYIKGNVGIYKFR